MSAHEEWFSAASDKIEAEQCIETIKGWNFDTLHAQISSLTKVKDKLFRSKSAREFLTASTREQRLPSKLSLERPDPTIAPITTAGYRPDSHCLFICLHKRFKTRGYNFSS